MKKFLSVLLAAWLPLAASAAGDPADAWLREALARNPEIAAARERWEAARARVPQASAIMDPMAGAMLMRSDSTAPGDYDMVEWMVTQQLPGFGKRGARKQAATREAEAAGYDYLETLRVVRARLVAARWDLWAARRTLQISRRALELAGQLEQAAFIRNESGVGSQSDALRAGIERARLTDDVRTREQSVRLAEAALNAILNAPPDTPRDPGDPPRDDAALPDPGALLARAATNNAMLAARARMLESRRAALKAARLEYAPDIELTVKARQPRGGGGIQEYDTGIALSFPWLWRGKYRGMIREAEADLAAAESDYTNAQNRLSVEVHELHLKADAAARRIRLLEDTVLENSRRLVDVALADYEAGRADFPALLEASQALLDAETEHVEALAAYARGMAAIEQATGPADAPNETPETVSEGE